MMRPGLPFASIAVALAAAASLAVSATAVEGRVVVNQLIGLAMIIYVVSLVSGSARWIGSSSVPLLGATAIEAGFGEEPTWMRSLIIGCLWFVAVEAGWEAIDRRGGARYTMAASTRRLQEVAFIIGISTCIGAVATLAAGAAPTRSVLLQGFVVSGLLVAFVLMVRALLSEIPDDQPATGWFSRRRRSRSDQLPFPDGQFGPEPSYPAERAGDR